MAITRWAPFSAFTSLEREMQEMFDKFTSRPWFEGFSWKPSTDVYRDEGELVVRAEIPGIDPEKGLKVEVEGNVLHIEGEKKEEKEVEEDNRFVRECHYGSFRRDVLLPEGVTDDDIRATFDNGVLTVRVAVPVEEPEEAAPKAVKIPVAIPELTSSES